MCSIPKGGGHSPCQGGRDCLGGVVVPAGGLLLCRAWLGTAQVARLLVVRGAVRHAAPHAAQQALLTLATPAAHSDNPNVAILIDSLNM